MSKPKYAVGSVSPSVAARNHAICDGAIVVALVHGGGYPILKGWCPRTEALTRWIVDAMNEKAAREENT